MKIFLTGDRSLDPMVSVLAAAHVVQQLTVSDPDLELVTGDLRGFEAAVRYLVPEAQVTESSALPGGKPDFDARHARVAKDVDLAVFVHPDPLDSRIYQSLVKFFDDDSLRVVSF